VGTDEVQAKRGGQHGRGPGQALQAKFHANASKQMVRAVFRAR